MENPRFNYKFAKQKLKEKNIKYQDLSFYLAEKGVTTSVDAIKGWFRTNDETRNFPELIKVKLIAQLLEVEINELILGFDGPIGASVKFVPVVGEASCGISVSSAYQATGKSVPYHGDFWHKELYALVACGDSMATDIEDGDEVICDPNATVIDGDIVNYSFLGENAIKIYHENAQLNAVELIPFNPSPEFKVRAIRKDDDNFKDLIMHKVVSVNKLRLNNRKARLRAVGRA